MSEILFDIVFKGRFSREIGKEKAILHFAKIFKQSPQKAELFFDGKARVLKKSLNMEKANHIRAMLKKAGLRVSLDKIQQLEPEAKDESITVDKVGAVIVKKPYVAPLHVDTSGMDLDEVGAKFAEKKVVETPKFDLDDYQLDEVGSQMAEKRYVVPVDYDLSHLEASEIEGGLEQKTKVEAKNYNFEGLSVDDVGAQMAEKKQVPPPEYDLDNIELSD